MVLEQQAWDEAQAIDEDGNFWSSNVLRTQFVSSALLLIMKSFVDIPVLLDCDTFLMAPNNYYHEGESESIIPFLALN
jgi:hypothetical protein